MYKTNKPLTVRVPGPIAPEVAHPPVTLPAGLRAKPILRGGTAGKFWIDEFPADLFPPGSIIRHDAEHYGITIESEDVTE